MAIRYSRQVIDSSDVKNHVKTLTSDWLTTGPNIEKFEKDIKMALNLNAYPFELIYEGELDKQE